MSTENLWGELPKPEQVRTPLQILREQASYLTASTDGVLVGQVSPNPDSLHHFAYELSIRAAALNNYVATILTVNYDIEMYPLRLDNRLSGPYQQCNDEAAYLNALKSVLQSAPCRKLVSALITQSSAASSGDA